MGNLHLNKFLNSVHRLCFRPGSTNLYDSVQSVRNKQPGYESVSEPEMLFGSLDIDTTLLRHDDLAVVFES